MRTTPSIGRLLRKVNAKIMILITFGGRDNVKKYKNPGFYQVTGWQKTVKLLNERKSPEAVVLGVKSFLKISQISHGNT